MAPSKRKFMKKASKTSSSSGGSSTCSDTSTTEHADFRNYSYKVLREIYSDTGITKKAMDMLNVLVNYMFQLIATEAKELMEQSQRTTMTANDIQNAVRRVLPGELQKHAVSEGTKAVAKFKNFYYSTD